MRSPIYLCLIALQPMICSCLSGSQELSPFSSFQTASSFFCNSSSWMRALLPGGFSSHDSFFPFLRWELLCQVRSLQTLAYLQQNGGHLDSLDDSTPNCGSMHINHPMCLRDNLSDLIYMCRNIFTGGTTMQGQVGQPFKDEAPTRGFR